MAKPDLKAVQATMLEPPYPSTTRAKGIKFEIDAERMYQSKTWVIASVELRPWLLMLWLESWRSVPVGSFDDDDEMIAGRIGMPLQMFQMHKMVMMRGWVRHSDGLLYHNTITESVLALIKWREGNARRQDDRREKLRVERVARERRIKELEEMSRVTSALPTGDTTLPTLPSPSPSPPPSPSPEDKEKNPPKKPKRKTPVDLIASANVNAHCVRSCLEEWVAYKQEGRKPYKSARGVTAASNVLGAASNANQRLMVDSAIAGGWEGLHTISGGNSSGTRNNRNENSIDRARRVADKVFGRTPEPSAQRNEHELRGAFYEQGIDGTGTQDVAVALDGEFSRER